MRSAATATTSLPAFKAYLLGESLMRAGEFERAAEAYFEALAHDSAFGLAYYRLALAREWAPLPGNEEAASAAARHDDRLSARERALLQAYRAWRAGDAAEAERAYRAIVARYPDDVEGWQQLARFSSTRVRCRAGAFPSRKRPGGRYCPSSRATDSPFRTSPGLRPLPVALRRSTLCLAHLPIRSREPIAASWRSRFCAQSAQATRRQRSPLQTRCAYGRTSRRGAWPFSCRVGPI